LTRYAKRVDANHGLIRAEFRRLIGTENVIDTSKAGFGLGDLIITYGGEIMLIEIKTATGKLTKAQERSKLPQRLVRNVEDARASVDVLVQNWHDITNSRIKRLREGK
jgi:hypothetical protein